MNFFSPLSVSNPFVPPYSFSFAKLKRTEHERLKTQDSTHSLKKSLLQSELKSHMRFSFLLALFLSYMATLQIENHLPFAKQWPSLLCMLTRDMLHFLGEI